MTESLLQRLHDALQPRYSVRDKLGEGGMAIVYRGYDHSLEREVAIKVLRPELATAVLAERFLREARLSAGISHPNVVSIHDFGEIDGLSYFVMDLVSGETLQARLKQGPLSHDEAVTLALEILEALEAAHALGIVHRDIKPANVFVTDGRAFLGDFGIAVQVDRTARLTEPGQAIGTRAYMAPEQLTGVATEATDIYAVGMVLYESLTGRHWLLSGGIDGADWKGIPRQTTNPLRRALLSDPERRWQTAATFRSQLRKGPRLHPLVWGTATFALIVLVAVFGILPWMGDAPGASRTDLALLPCTSLPSSAELSDHLGFLAVSMLRDVSGARFTSYKSSSMWRRGRSELAGASDDSVAVEAKSALNTDRVAFCRMVRDGADSLRITLRMFDRDGILQHLAPIFAPADDPPVAAAIVVALRLLESVDSTIPLSSTGYAALLGHDPEAVSAFLSGALAVRRDAREEAIRHFADAVEIDPSFSLAVWRLADVQRWSMSSSTIIDLDRLFSEHADDLGAVDKKMLEATVAPRGPEQFERYHDLIADHPNDPFATLSYGDELFHRGPLFGIGLDSALVVLTRATEQDSFLAPAYDHLTWLQIRLGDGEQAARTLSRLNAIAGEPEMRVFLRLGYVERFQPEQAPALRDAVFGPRVAGDLVQLLLAARFGASFGVPETQLEIGRRLVLATGPFPTVRDGPLVVARTNGHLAQGLALVALGRPQPANAHFDSAAAAVGTSEAQLVAAQWRVLPQVVGLIGVRDSERVVGRAVLRDLAGDPEIETRLRARAAWSLSLVEAEEGDFDAARQWLEELRALPLEGGDSALLVLGEAALAAEAGDVQRALAISTPLAEYDSAAILQRPFQRAVSHLYRGDWFAQIGSPERADSAWTWYENLDLEGLPVGSLQAAEVDWALGVHGRMRRARFNKRDGHDARACALATEVIRYWSDAAPEFGPLVEEARAMCPS